MCTVLKRILSVFLVLASLVVLGSCSSGGDEGTVNTERWTGKYMWLNEETEEFKLLDAVGIDEQTVSFILESSRISEEFQARTKSASGRYLVENLGSKTVKVTLSSDGDMIVVDDMWTDDISLRQENWTGKYYRIQEGDEVPKFGDKAWNGKYICDALGQEVSVYGIREGYALFTYNGQEDGEEVIYSLRCLEAEKGKAVFTEGQRLIILERMTRGRLKVTDLYMNDSENKGISGIYTKK